MTEEKPLAREDERIEDEGSNLTIEDPEPSGSALAEEPKLADSDGIAAALSALSTAAAPLQAESGPFMAIEPEALTASFTAATDIASDNEAAPPPPPAPQDAESYPPPTGDPIAVTPVTSPAPAAGTTAMVPPTPTTKRKKWPWILAICLVAGALLLGSVVACTSAVVNVAFDSIQYNERHGHQNPFDDEHQGHLWNYYERGSVATYDDLLDVFDVEEGTITPDGFYAEGAYRVGGDDGIAAGLYYLDGVLDGVSNFYVFSQSDDAKGSYYDVEAMVEYFGNYYAELEEGDAIVFLPFSSNSTMHIASSQPMDVVAPYTSGCYRVGIDIPAGTYTITCDSDTARLTDSEAGAYVMEDVDFEADEPFVSESVYVIKGGRQTISVADGDYLELFASIATPATASTRIPLQHVESEHSHDA